MNSEDLMNQLEDEIKDKWLKNRMNIEDIEREKQKIARLKAQNTEARRKLMEETVKVVQNFFVINDLKKQREELRQKLAIQCRLAGFLENKLQRMVII